jgi:catechol 2,3-dioxygenase-like lactoylglutathione lyase family enzyme
MRHCPTITCSQFASLHKATNALLIFEPISALNLPEVRMNISVRHIALFVPDLRSAESYYRSIFDMALVGREAELPDGLWYTLPFDKGWYEAVAAGIELGMLALRKDEFGLALFRGDAPPGQVYVIGLRMPTEEIAKVRARLPDDTQVLEDEPDYLEFRDPYQITWQIMLPESKFSTAGEFANRWLKL